jgi:hypothetical protein
MALITNLQHFLDENGTIPEEIPAAAHNLALFLGSIVGWVTSHEVSGDERTNVPCRRSPRRRRCSGIIYAWLGPDGATITWGCPTCHDEGTICGWEETLWDRRAGRPRFKPLSLN